MKKYLSLFLKTIISIISFLVIIFIIAMFALIKYTDDSVKKDDIFTLVIEHQQLLENDIVSGDYSDTHAISAIKKIQISDSIIDFSCGGSGLGSATYYCGFYYSEQDDLCAIWCAPPSSSLLKSSGDGYLYEETNGDNRYYTEHICGHFYYYEASF